jgi:queuine/archaeosine tRNA-ribosyltransferase
MRMVDSEGSEAYIEKNPRYYMSIGVSEEMFSTVLRGVAGCDRT